MITAALFVWLALQSVSPEGAKHMQAGVEAQKQGQFDVAVKEFRKATESATAAASPSWRSNAPISHTASMPCGMTRYTASAASSSIAN